MALVCLRRGTLRDFERAFEVAGTGIGVVFLALMALTLITMLLTRFLKMDDAADARPSEETSETVPVLTGSGVSQPEDDPAAVAAMVAAVQVVRGGVPQTPASKAATAGTWRSQGRQALMQSQGSSARPRSHGR